MPETSIKNTFIPMVWENISDRMWDHPEYPHVDLYDMYSGLCSIYPDGTIDLKTSTGGGHGDPGGGFGRQNLQFYFERLSEIIAVGRHYYGDDWGKDGIESLNEST